MADHVGFPLKTLTETARNAGFRSVLGQQRAASFALWVLASKARLPEAELKRLAAEYFPR